MCLIKQRLKFKNYKKYLKSNGNILRSQKKKKKKKKRKKERKKERKKKTESAVHNVFTENVNRIALSFNGDNH